MRKFQKVLSYVLVAVLASALTFGLTEVVPSAKVTRGEGTFKLQELANLIEERFIGEYDETAMEDAAAFAMVDALGDRWSYYIPASEYAEYQEQMNNAYVGIGITILQEEDQTGFRVTKVNMGGPAEEAGIQVGDVIVGAAGKNIAGMTADELRDLVRGEENTAVTLTVRRGEEELEMTVTRKQVATPVAAARMLRDNVGLVSIFNFDTRCFDETHAAITQLLEQGAEALIFDVRFNPGGYKHELVKVLDFLLPEGPLFRSEDYLGNVQVDKSGPEFLDVPMAVLVNGDSYSAAEFFAAALREYEAAVVVGTQTSGKGYFQTTIPMSDGSAVGLSVGKYTTPQNVSLAGVGITPDVVVELDEEQLMQLYTGLLDPNEDPQIQAALEALGK